MRWKIISILLLIGLVVQSLAYSNLKKEIVDKQLEVDYIKFQAIQLLRGCN